MTLGVCGALLLAAQVSSAGPWDQLRPVVFQRHERLVCSVTFSSDGKILASGGNEGVAKLVDANTGKPMSTMTIQGGCLNAIALSPPGDLVAIAAPQGVTLWSTKSAKLCRSIGANNAALSVAFSRDGKLLAAGGKERATVWEVSSGRLLAEVKQPGSAGWIAITPDGKTILTVDDQRVSIWKWHDGKECSSVQLTAGTIHSVAFAPDGKMFAIGDHNGVTLWDAETRKLAGEFVGAGEYVPALAFSPDGRMLASVTMEVSGAVRVWETLTRKQRATLRVGFYSIPMSLAFAPDSKALVAGLGFGFGGGVVVHWRLFP